MPGTFTNKWAVVREIGAQSRKVANLMEANLPQNKLDALESALVSTTDDEFNAMLDKLTKRLEASGRDVSGILTAIENARP